MSWIIFISAVIIIGRLSHFQGFYINASVKGKVPLNLGDWIAPNIFIGGALLLSFFDKSYFVIWLVGGFVGIIISSRF